MKEERDKKNINKKHTVLITIILFIFSFVLLFILFKIIKNLSENIITSKLPNMNQYHSTHNSLQINDNGVLILGNGISYGISELYLTKQKRFKIYSNEPFGKYILYADNQNVFYYDTHKIICYNPQTAFTVKYEIKLDLNNIHPKICLTNNNQILIYGGKDKHKNQSQDWLIYDIDRNKILDNGTWPIKITENSEIIEIKPNLFLVYSSNFLYQTNYGNFQNLNKICNKFLYNLKIYPEIYVNNSILITFYENQNSNNIKFALINTKNLELTEIKTAYLNSNFKSVMLPNKKLLLIGTSSDSSDNRGIYLFNPLSVELQFLGNMRYSRKFHDAILMNDNKTILITGGSYDSNELNGEKTAEIFKMKE